MPKLFIPWKLFFEYLRKQPANRRQQWLQLWRFNDRGVVLVPDILTPVDEACGETDEALRKNREHAVLSLITNRNQTKTLH